MASPPTLLTSTKRGTIEDAPTHAALGRSGSLVRAVRGVEWSPMPEGTVLHYLPGRAPRGRNLESNRIETVATAGKDRHEVVAVAAMLPNGWARTLLPAFEVRRDAETLPFYGYTAVGYDEETDEMRVAAVQTEDSFRWSPFQYDTPDLRKTVERRLKESPKNRLLAHHGHCALDYGCYNAQNIFYRRWEGAIAVAAACNARCQGCISLQPDDKPPSPQERLDFVPTVDEIVEIGVPHLQSGEAILSFGQGCEGEPLLKAPLIASAIREMRRQTPRGTIHLNTNASAPDAVSKLIESGLDSIRISLNSVTPARYEAYYRPASYSFAEVAETARRCAAAGIQLTVNLLYFPGLNDTESELGALEAFLQEHRVHQVQMRNLNIDPDEYVRTQPPIEEEGIGVPEMIERLRRICLVGNATPPIRA